jgi:vacuolar-type H+-ATPase subunit I/STV1
MSKKPPMVIYRGRSLGIVILTVAQLVIGIIHTFFGLMLLVYENFSISATAAYDVYTFVFGLFALFFAVLFWRKNKAGWIGTVAVSLFVIAADFLTLLNLPSIPGIPKFPAITEIGYSLLVVFYLFQGGVRKKYLVLSKEKKLEKTK